MDQTDASAINLVMAFAPASLLVEKKELYDEIAGMFPQAQILIASACDEFIDEYHSAEDLMLTAIAFEHARVKTAMTDMATTRNSFDAGYYLSRAFNHELLRALLVFCDGHRVNASQLAFSLQQYIPSDVIITGAIAGSSDTDSLIGLNCSPASGRIACIALYGERLQVAYGNESGWIPFGPERIVTRSKSNTVYEIGSMPILEVYNLYLRDPRYLINGRPVLFPVAVRFENSQGTVIRTIQSIDEELCSITYSGNVPEGSRITLLRTHRESMIQGAAQAVTMATGQCQGTAELALVMSCRERQSILNEKINDEIKAMKNALNPRTALSGLFTPGEIAPAGPDMKCELFKQSVIVTAISESL
jgi:hypothetical protein